ncbi:MAG: WD40/YVTN/BNR-like repeat-containing protein [Steroidobacteraceae bacterium]
MKHWVILASACVGACLGLAWPAQSQEEAPSAPPAPPARVVVDVRSDRILLLDLVKAGNRLIAAGERGFTLVSDDGGESWQGRPTPVTRTLTALAFKDARTGVAVGHGGSLIRTDDGGTQWQQVQLEDAGTDSLLGVTHLGGDHFIAYGAFGLYFDSQDAGRTWTRGRVLGEDFDRHISQVIPVADSLLLVAESGTLARSDDGGVTWTELTSPYAGSYFGAVAVPDGGVVVFGMRGQVYRTADMGATWRKVELGTTTSLMSGRVLSDGRVLLVGNAGLLAVSRDGGQTFELHASNGGKGFTAAIEVDGRVILAGEGGITPLDPAWLAK